MALTRRELDNAGCDDCGDHQAHELWFHAVCHPDYPTWAHYQDGMLILTCSQDGEEVARVMVAGG